MNTVDAEALIARWRALRAEVEDAGASLLAVSKYAPDEAVSALLDAGQLDFGESRPQQLRDRARRFPEARWHMIGPVQKNKAKYVGRFAAMWHSVEDARTARLVARHVQGRRLPVLVQVNVLRLPGRHGVLPEAAAELVEELGSVPELEFAGLMCMAAKGGDARAAFSALRHLRDALAGGSLRRAGQAAPILCMGMSGDWREALEEGSDMVRLGSALFGDSRAEARPAARSAGPSAAGQAGTTRKEGT